MDETSCPDCGHPASAHDPKGWEDDAPRIECQECPNQTCEWRKPE